MALPTIQLRPGARARALQGHPWVYATELADEPAGVPDGAAVRLLNAQGRGLGSGLFNRKSVIRWRRFADGEAELDAALLRRRLTAALARRAGATVGRLVWSEADSLPGLVVDRFGPALVAQFLTLGMDQRKDTVLEILAELTGCPNLLLRGDAPSREYEGLPRLNGVWRGSGEPFLLEIDGLKYELDLLHQQKTGFYLDQRAQHLRVAALAKGRRVLDLCCNQGSFALQALRLGAAAARAVDISEACVAAAAANAARAGLELETLCANAFDYGRERAGQEQWDLIVLDPPSFARNRESVAGALRGYKELHLRALKMLSPGGLLATYSCSQHVSRLEFEDTLREAAADARQPVRLLERAGQPPDHPVLLAFPESEYLKGLLVELA